MRRSGGFRGSGRGCGSGEVPSAVGHTAEHHSAAVNGRAAGAVTAIALIRRQDPADVVHALRTDRRPAEDVVSGRAAQRPTQLFPAYPFRVWLHRPETRRSTTRSPRSMLVAGSRTPRRCGSCNGPPGLRITLMVTLGAVVAAAHPDGRDAVTSQGHLRLPADLRHALRLEPGDRLLVAAHPDRDSSSPTPCRHWTRWSRATTRRWPPAASA